MQTRIVDLSMGCQHLRDIAEESGMEWEVVWSNEQTETIQGHTIETWYNESANSPWHAWGAFCKGYGSRTAPSKEEAVEFLLKLIKEKQSS
jgi:hypothetical protein